VTIAYSTFKPVHRLLTAQGYSVTAQLAHRDLAPGCALSLQFADRIRPGRDGRPHFAMRVRVEIGAYETLDDSKVTHWTMKKSAFRSIACEWTRLSLEIELFAATTVPVESLRLQAELFQKNFRPLLEEADTMLKRQLVYDAQSDAPGPPLRLECRLIGDLFVGRSGLLSFSEKRTMSRDHREANRVACGWLMQSILPELSKVFSVDTSATQSQGKAVAAQSDLVETPKVHPLRTYARARVP
jgi:hypothetical protein